MSGGILLFENSSTGGQGGVDYDKDAFTDISLPASNNSGFSSTVSTNPLAGYFGNDAAPKWGVKTLWVKDLTRVEDRSLWVNGKATYRIVWNENFPGVEGYAFGGVSLQGTDESRSLSISDINDGAGVVGVIQRVQWLLRPQVATTTATPSVDGVNKTAFTIGGYANLGSAFSATKAFYNAYTDDTSDATLNIHDHRVTSGTIGGLQVYGVVVYFSIPGSGINLYPGTVYVDKSKTTLTGSSLAFPTGASNFLGGNVGIYTDSNGVFGITTSPIPGIGSNCSGASGTNLLSVAIGTGASYLINMGILIPDGGSSYYLGQVTNVSGDVLTVSPTLAIGLSNVCSALFTMGLSTSTGSTLFEQAFSYMPGVQHQSVTGSSFLSGVAPFSFSDPYFRYRAWGSTLRFNYGSSLSSSLGASIGLQFPTTSDFLQIDGKWSALEFEYLVGTTASVAATLTIDGGIGVQAINQAFNGPSVVRLGIMSNAAFGMHSVRLMDSGSTNALLSRVIGYRPKINSGPSFGLLAQIPLGITFLTQNAQNATMMAMGNITRVYAEQLRCNGTGWTSTPTLSGPGGRNISTTTAGDYMEFTYYGTRFALLGTVGASTLVSVDGSSIGFSYNAWGGSGLTLGFHTVRATNQSGTGLVIYGIDFLNPYHEIRNQQIFDPIANVYSDIRMYQQPGEPLNARPGDFWEQNVTNKAVYQKAVGGWQLMSYARPTALYQLNSGFTLITNSTTLQIPFVTKVYDNYSAGTAVGATGWIWTAPYAGKYEVSALIKTVSAAATFTASAFISLTVFKNNVAYSRLGEEVVDANITRSVAVCGTAVVDCLQGDALSIVYGTNLGAVVPTDTTVGNNYVTITKVDA